jgi:hypothetical protein
VGITDDTSVARVGLAWEAWVLDAVTFRCVRRRVDELGVWLGVDDSRGDEGAARTCLNQRFRLILFRYLNVFCPNRSTMLILRA